jgi:hypothetical protein
MHRGNHPAMKTTTLLAAVALAAAFQLPAGAGEPEVQLSVLGGQQRLRIDHDRWLGAETVREDAWRNGVALGLRTPAGFVAEAGIAHAVRDEWGSNDGDIELYHYSAAIGWQFDVERWRFTPRVGAQRSKLNSEARLLLNDDGSRTDKLYDTVPFVDVSLQRRLGNHWAVGVMARDSFEEFGHSRSWGFAMTLNW